MLWNWSSYHKIYCTERQNVSGKPFENIIEPLPLCAPVQMYERIDDPGIPYEFLIKISLTFKITKNLTKYANNWQRHRLK